MFVNSSHDSTRDTGNQWLNAIRIKSVKVAPLCVCHAFRLRPNFLSSLISALVGATLNSIETNYRDIFDIRHSTFDFRVGVVKINRHRRRRLQICRDL